MEMAMEPPQSLEPGESPAAASINVISPEDAASRTAVSGTRNGQRKEHRTKAQRASRACLSCRVRKVKCDVVTNSPCSNCRWDGTQCVVPRTRRTRKFFFGAPDAVDQSSSGVTYVNPTTGQTQAADTQSCFNDLDADTMVDPGTDPDSNTDRQDQHYNTDAASTIELPHTGDPINSIIQPSNDPNPFSNLPAFIVPPSIPNLAYAAFLKSQGVLLLPSVTAQCELIKAFVEFIYPRMPLLDLDSFLACVSSPDGSKGRLSLVLYYAILFAGSTHANINAINAQGYSDRKLFRRELYRKVELLIELDTEKDRLVMVQAALLLTCRGVSDNEHKDSWHWVNTAISFAFTINLHRNSATHKVPLREQRLFRRLWWCCFVRDTMLSLGMHRPTRIKEHDFDVPMLEFADLESSLMTRRHALLEHSFVGPFDQTKELESAELCVQKIRLTVLVNEVLQLQAEANSQGEMVALMPANDSKYVHGINALDSALKSWRKALPRSCCYRKLTNQNSMDTTPVDVRRQLLHMVYYTALYTLHRPRFLPDSPRRLPNKGLNQSQEASKALVLDSANNITRLAAELHQHNMDCDLPISAITVLCPAISMHLLYMKSQSQNVRDMAMSNFRVCMSIMEKMRKLYSAAEVTVNFLEMALRRASINGIFGSEVRDVFASPDQDGRADTLTILHQALPTQTSENTPRVGNADDRDSPDEIQRVDMGSTQIRLDTPGFNVIPRNLEFPIDPLQNIDIEYHPPQDLDGWMVEPSREWSLDTGNTVASGNSLLGWADFADPFTSL